MTRSTTNWRGAIAITLLVGGCSTGTSTPDNGIASPPVDGASSGAAQDIVVDATPAFPPGAADTTATTPAVHEVTESADCSNEWAAVIDPFFAAVQLDNHVDVSAAPVAGGCRFTSSLADTTLSVLIEATTPRVIGEVTAARESSTSMMGFDEVGYFATSTGVSSSLLHPEIGRLVESRWFLVDETSALHLEVVIDAGGQQLRDTVLTPMNVLEAAAIEHQLARTAEGVDAMANDDDGRHAAVTTALDLVLTRVSNTVPLGSLATTRGAESIAFEYAFAENFVALASAAQPDDCSVAARSAQCNIDGTDAEYRFTFIHTDDGWLLDEFVLAPR